MRSINIKNLFLLALSVFLSFSLKGQIRIPEKVDKGIMFIAADSSFSVNLNGRIQNLYTGELNLDNNSYRDGFSVRRARLKLEGFAYNPAFEYKIELALSNQDTGGGTAANSNTANIVLDAVAKWNFAPGYSFWFGQTKLPGNRERLVSSQKLQFVDRSLLNNRYNLDRDMGVQLHHESAIGRTIFRQILSVSMGEGRNITTDNRKGYDYTGRVEFLPFGHFKSDGDYFGSDLSRETSPKLSVGISYDFNDNATRERGQLGDFFDQSRDLKTVFADAMFKVNGFSMMAEYADKISSGSPVVKTDINGVADESFFTGTGLNIQAGYLFKNNLEVAGRYTSINPESVTQREKNDQFTLGLSKYLAGHTLKLQSDISLLKAQQSSDELMYRFQIEIGF
jgi:phosphate-selective porin OprO and OprP